MNDIAGLCLPCRRRSGPLEFDERSCAMISMSLSIPEEIRGQCVMIISSGEWSFDNHGDDFFSFSVAQDLHGGEKLISLTNSFPSPA